MHRGDKEYLLDILEACRRIVRYTEGLSYEEFLSNEEILINKLEKDSRHER